MTGLHCENVTPRPKGALFLGVTKEKSAPFGRGVTADDVYSYLSSRASTFGFRPPSRPGENA